MRPEFRPEIPIKQLLSSLLSDSTVRMRVAQWIVDEASITVAYNLRFDTTSIMVEGATNDNGALEAISEGMGVGVISGATPPKGHLPTHIVKVQGARAYGLLEILSKELTGLKAREAEAAIEFFPASGIVKGKVTTDVYMAAVWRKFASESTTLWNTRRRVKLSPARIDEIVDAWVLNRTARARRGLEGDNPTRAESTSATP